MPAYDHCQKIMKQHLHKFLNKSKASKFWHTTESSSKKLWEDFVNSANHLPAKCSKKLRKHAVKLAKNMETEMLNLKKSLKTSSSKMASSAKRSISCISPAYNDQKLEKLMKKCEKIMASIEKYHVECEGCESKLPEDQLKTESSAEQQTAEEVQEGPKEECFHECFENF